jgi:hypothetical protein
MHSLESVELALLVVNPAPFHRGRPLSQLALQADAFEVVAYWMGDGARLKRNTFD